MHHSAVVMGTDGSTTVVINDCIRLADWSPSSWRSSNSFRNGEVRVLRLLFFSAA